MQIMGDRIQSHSMLREILLSRMGRWRTDFLWRFFGLVICQLGILLLHDTDTVEKFLLFPIGFHLTLVCGLLLILFGPRLILLFLTSVAMFIFLIPWIGEVVERQVADEYILLLVLPTVGVCLTLICSLRKDTRDEKKSELDAAHISVFRISVIIAMFFATFHKLNADFFNPEVSCASALSKELSLWWRFPFPKFMLNVKPYQIVLGEGLIPVLLIFYPRVGILFTLLFLGLIGHIGPTVFTMMMFMMACAFFRHEDGAIILKRLERHWSWLLVIILVVLGISSKLYTGKRTWFEFHVYQNVMITLVFCVLWSFTADWKERRNSVYLKTLLTPRFNLRTLFPSDKAIRIALISFALLFFLNGMSPYFGLKYRLSFAMLSNLRVDEARWNSLLIQLWKIWQLSLPTFEIDESHFTHFCISQQSMA